MKISKTFILRGFKRGKEYIEYYGVIRGDEKEELSAVWRLGTLGLESASYKEADFPKDVYNNMNVFVELDDMPYSVTYLRDHTGIAVNQYNKKIVINRKEILKA
jgi:hypothetical protein